MPTDIKNRLVTEVQNYIRANHRMPTKIHLTLEEETELYMLTPEQIGSLSAKIAEHGTRSAMKRILGMEIFWDAEHFRIE